MNEIITWGVIALVLGSAIGYIVSLKKKGSKCACGSGGCCSSKAKAQEQICACNDAEGKV